MLRAPHAVPIWNRVINRPLSPTSALTRKRRWYRRNQTPEQTSYYRGKLMNQLEKRQGIRTDLTSSQNETKLAADEVMEQYGVSRATAYRDAAYAAAVDTKKSRA